MRYRFLRFMLVLLLMLMACNEADSDDSSRGPRAELTQSTAPPPLVSTEDNASADSTLPPDATETATTDEPTATDETEIALAPRDYILGDDDAFVTIVMYGDFQSRRAARYARDLEILRAEYPGELRLVWRHLPDTQSHDKAALAFRASEAAAAQGRFWDMHAILFTTQSEWLDLTPDAFREELISYAAAAGFDVAQFEDHLDNPAYAELLEAYQQQAADLDIVGVPTLLVNGEPFSDRDDLYGLDGAMRLALLARQHFDAAPPMSLDLERDYFAVIQTSKGEIRIDLLENDAPVSVNNFVFLAEQGWYDNTTFFLVVPEFYAQAGDPSATGRGSPGYWIPGEHDNGYIFDQPGLVAMSHPPGEPDRAGSQFFITYGPLPNHQTEWDRKYTVFGTVVSGIEVLEALTPRNPGDPLRFPNPPPGDRIETIRIEVE